MKQAKLKTTRHLLPIYWASYLINDDGSSLDDTDIAEIDAYVKGLGHCLDMVDDGWHAFNDANNLGSDCGIYFFTTGEREDQLTPYVDKEYDANGNPIY